MHAGGPEYGSGGNDFRAIGSMVWSVRICDSTCGLNGNLVILNIDDWRAGVNCRAKALERSACFGRQSRIESRKDSVGRFDEDHLGLPRIDVPKIAAQCLVREFTQHAGQFDAGRPATDDYQREPRLNDGGIGIGVVLGIGFALRAFEGGENAAAYLCGIFDGFQSWREWFPLVVAEVLVLYAGGQDKRIVPDFAITQMYFAGRRIDVQNFAQQNFRIGLPLEERAKRSGDVGGGQAAGGHLIQEGLKQVKIAAVDERDGNRGAA